MKAGYHRLVSFLLFAGIHWCLVGQEIPEAEFFSVQNGLSQSQVNCVMLDSYGYLWIGTQDGLNRYDGITFQHYHYIPFDTSSLSSNYVRSLSEDKEGNLWIATDNGLNRYNRVNGDFSRVRIDKSGVPITGSDQLYGVLADPDGNIWLKSADRLYKYRAANQPVQDYPHYKNPFNFVSGLENYPIHRDSDNILWIGTKDGLNQFDEKTGKFILYSNSLHEPGSISDNFVKAIFEDRAGRLWIGTNYGLNLFDRQSKKFEHFFPVGSDAHKAGNTINAIIEDLKGNLWLGTAEGVQILDPATRRSSGILKVIANNQQLDLTTVTSLVLDRSGIIWIGALEGLYKVDTKPKKFNLYRNKLHGGPRFSSDLFSAVWQDQAGRLWLGTWNDGLNVFDRATGKVLLYSRLSTDPNFRLCDDQVFSILGTRDGSIFVGTQNGLEVMSQGEKRFSSVCQKYPDINCNLFKNNRIYRMIEDRRGNIWIGAAFGLYRINREDNLLINFSQIRQKSQNLDLKFVYSLAEDSSGRIWIGGNFGVLMYDYSNGLFTHYRHSDNPADSSLTTNSVYSMLHDSKGTIWVGTECGLNRFHKETGHFTYYTMRDGLPNSLINSIEEDKHGMIWVSTNKGLAQLNPESGEITSYDLSDGLQNYEYNINCSWKGLDGELFFGGLSGLNSFYSDSIHLNYAVPPVLITSVEFYEDNVINRTSFGAVTEITIPWSIRNFVINYASLDFTYPVKNRYLYQLTEAGDEGVWIDTKGRTSASFLNLSPGVYDFRVKGSNSDNIWNETGASLRIIVKGPFWLSGYAYGVYAFILLAAVGIFLQLRMKKLRITNKVLAEKQIAALRIEKQREELILKNRNITDSLIYAKRIQEALMPSEKLFKRLLPESFILYKPKDIVSGDFYWIVEKNGLIGIAAVDCTGHGVPGAFMSIIGFELFRKLVNTEDLSDPARLLGSINQQFAEIFADVESDSLRDGMDLAFCTIDPLKRKLIFAGAINPLYLIRDNKVIEIKGDRFSLGLDEHSPTARTFTNTETELLEEDVLYIFSDGFADQFGGEDGKKFKYRRFRFLLLNIHSMEMERQKTTLEEAFDTWRGNYDQVDDILVMGFKPLKRRPV
ncbi:MAG: two-component regulator propeller domain-containing protein [Bacteroidales bacterium]